MCTWICESETILLFIFKSIIRGWLLKVPLTEGWKLTVNKDYFHIEN